LRIADRERVNAEQGSWARPGAGPVFIAHLRTETTSRYEKQATTARANSGPKSAENSEMSIPAPRTRAIILSAIILKIPFGQWLDVRLRSFPDDFVDRQNSFVCGLGMLGEAQSAFPASQWGLPYALILPE
jgi:hypothetical protein